MKVQVEACDQRTHKVAYPFITAIDLLLDRFEPILYENPTRSARRTAPAIAFGNPTLLSQRRTAPAVVGKSGRIKFTSVRYVPYEDKNGFKWIYDMSFNLQTMKCKVTDLDRAIAECFLNTNG